MSLLIPDHAPRIHIEELPETSVAVEAYSVPSSTYSSFYSQVKIATWAPGSVTIYGEGSDEDPDSWCENNCDNCRYFTDEMEYSAEGEDVETPDGTLPLRGTYYTASPCNAYEDGIGNVCFPCVEGLDGPGDYSDEVDLPTNTMKYEILINVSEFGIYSTKQCAMQQRCFIDPDTQKITTNSNVYEAINCYSNDYHICWGDNVSGDSLLSIEDAYVNSEANQDLCSFDSHVHFNHLCRDTAADTPALYAVATPDKLTSDGQDFLAKGLAVAHALRQASAFLIMATNGAVTHDSIAYLPVYLYPQVAVDDDTILNIWATDELPTGKRLLFTTSYDPDGKITELIGAVDTDFNLTPCKSHKLQSSEPAALASN